MILHICKRRTRDVVIGQHLALGESHLLRLCKERLDLRLGEQEVVLPVFLLRWNGFLCLLVLWNVHLNGRLSKDGDLDELVQLPRLRSCEKVCNLYGKSK